jgi:osmotically-inducible protein OsmY
MALTTNLNSPLDARISSVMSAHPHLKQRKLRFETQQGHVVLRGVVNSYYQKQMAQEAVRRVEGVHSIENHLEVNWPVAPAREPLSC